MSSHPSHLKCLTCNQEYGQNEEPVGPCENCQLDKFAEEFFEQINLTSSRLLPRLSPENRPIRISLWGLLKVWI